MLSRHISKEVSTPILHIGTFADSVLITFRAVLGRSKAAWYNDVFPVDFFWPGKIFGSHFRIKVKVKTFLQEHIQFLEYVQ